MNDEKIIALFCTRNEGAIMELDKLYGKYFLKIAYTVLHNDEDAKEAVNDAYLKAWDTIPPEKPHNLKAFIGVSVRQISINRLEKNTAKKRGGGEYCAVLDEISEIVGNDEDYTDTLALKNAINEFLRSLSNETRRIFIKRYWHMNPISEIARELYISESKVKSILLRTRQKLKKYLENEGIEI